MPVRTPSPKPRKAQDIEAVMQNLRRMVKALQIYAASVEREYGITGPQLWALWELGRSGPLALKALAERMYLGGSTVVGVLDRLEARGLAERLQDPGDRRRVSIRLTPAGAALLAKAPHPAHGQLLHALQAMAAPRVAELREATDSLVHAMEADDLEARFFFSET
ncbi:MAG: MarR family transcriptional regulator [Holophagaceae bacterium]